MHLKVKRIMTLQEGKRPVDVAAEKGRADIASLLKKWAVLRKVIMVDSHDDKKLASTCVTFIRSYST
jgi:hypothetical protein